MIHYDLICDKGHAFDGWFRNSSVYDEQAGSGLVTCAHCGSTKVEKQIMAPGIAMKHSIIWPARAFMVTPTAGGIRVGGTVEMAGIDAAPDYRRSKVTVKRAKEALPNLQCEDFTEWMGHRPAFPDTVPVMSASAKTRGLFYATGHGHLGLTYAATNARLMADLMTGATPPVDMKPYRVDRF